MKILCAYSGVEFTVEHFPGSLYSRESWHPVFDMPQKKLLAYTGKWAGGELTTTDSYLLFLAILKSSDLVDFRTAVYRNEFTDSIIAQNMESLVRSVIKLNTVSNPAVVFPKYVISTETRYLSNVRYWIENWKEAYQKFIEGKPTAHESAKLIQRESALERLIKNPHKPISQYAYQLADWAALAGNFPPGMVPSPFSSKNISVLDYWKMIIIRCAKEEFLYSIPRVDLEELLEHCEENIDAGSIYSNALFKLLRKGIEKRSNLLELGDMDVQGTYQILEESDTIESANIKAMVDSAPLEIPRPEQYSSKIEFLRAKMRYQMAQKFKRQEDSENLNDDS